MKLIELPTQDVRDIPRGLRAIADRIEAGEFGEPYVGAWIIDCGEGCVEFGMLGETAQPGAVAHLLFAVCQRRLEGL